MKSQNIFRKYLQESLGFIKESKKSIFFMIYLFLGLFIIGFIIPAPTSISSIISEIIKGLALKTQNLNTLQLIQYIFVNNTSVSLLAIVFGVVLAIIPIILAITNGYVVGYVSRLAVNNQGILTLWKLFPHGIFELPAVLISLGLGFYISKGLFTNNSDKEVIRRLILSVKTFFMIIIPLLVIAALIEGTLIGILR
jgi:stage II sporulation protein M